jgi:hypothetical protein
VARVQTPEYEQRVAALSAVTAPQIQAEQPILRRAVAADVTDLANRMRHEDALEVLHAAGDSPLSAVQRAFSDSAEALTVTLDGRVVLMAGVVGMRGVSGIPWMLATDDLKKIRKSFLREGTAVPLRWLTEYRLLSNMVWVKNASHIQWLKWLGFSFDAPEVFGVSEEPFQRFYMKAP